MYIVYLKYGDCFGFICLLFVIGLICFFIIVKWCLECFIFFLLNLILILLILISGNMFVSFDISVGENIILFLLIWGRFVFFWWVNFCLVDMDIFFNV